MVCAADATSLTRSPGKTTYYADATTGDDAGPGTSPEKPWKTLQVANKVALAPGDRLLLAAGQTFAGPLRLTKETAGTKKKPILVSSFGTGRAVIDGGAGTAIQLDGCAEMDFFRLLADAPCAAAGVVVAENGGRDLFGRPVSSDKMPAWAFLSPADSPAGCFLDTAEKVT